MILVLLASLTVIAPGGLPDSISAELPGSYRLELHRYRQAPSWICCLRQWSPPEQWARYWPAARLEARESFGVWTRSGIPAGGRVTFDSLGHGSYRARACWNRDTTCSDLGPWRSIP